MESIEQLCNLFCAFAQVHCITGQVMKRRDSPQDACSQAFVSESVFQSVFVHFDLNRFQTDV